MMATPDDSYKEKQKENAEIKRRIINEHKRKHPCVDCGEKDIDVLEFDHVRGKKKASVAKIPWSNYSIDFLLREIEKCDMRCANCHQKKHIQERFQKTVLNEEK